jgi:hypothetical protein
VYQVAYVSDQYGWEAVFNVLVVSLLTSAVMVSKMAIRDFGYLKGAGKPQLESLQASPAHSQQQDDDAYAPPVMETVSDQDSTAGADSVEVPAGTQ